MHYPKLVDESTVAAKNPLHVALVAPHATPPIAHE